MSGVELPEGQCPQAIAENEVVLVTLERCAPCERAKVKLKDNGIEYRIMRLEDCNQIEGYAGKVMFAPSIYVRRDNEVIFVM